MENYLWIFIAIGVVVILVIISWIKEITSNSKKYLERKPKLDNLERAIKKHEAQVTNDKIKLEAESKERLDGFSQKVKKTKDEYDLKEKLWNEQIQKDKDEIQELAKQKSMGFPWLAEAYADYFALKDRETEKYLMHKKHPAYTASETVRIIKNEKKELLRENKVVRYKINYFEKLFPWLSELIADDEDEYIPVRIDSDIKDDNNKDRVKDFLTPEEYKNLPSVERNQMALDRYLKNRNKSKWAIGRDYEMYVGYLFEQTGYSIEYKGIIDGFDDLGRDVIAINDGEVCIIQCKCWAQYKEIHEKHIFQLFGTTMEYWIKNFNNYRMPKTFEEFAKFLKESKLRPIFFTSTSLSDKAKEMANALSVEIIENEPLGVFPRIKCNINNDEYGQTKIYHLPMDQQYDRTIIGNRTGEFYAFTVKEAEDAGFRRAFRHRF
ncbi:MAG: restriction endonuclease [Candidatus Scalindua sp.]|nr:restriction endonuclease [Candidatus Scalindua sp.]MCR4343849.1 restriction endonuclease [Candidatus Scalindua sp.]